MPDTLTTIRKFVVVPAGPDAAFELFTGKIHTWWPLETHSMSASEGMRPLGLAMEPQLGGRVVETRHDGESAEWATLTAWDRGRRLKLDWYVGRPRAQFTEIEVLFAANGGGSQVDLVHTGFERLGPAGAAAAAKYEDGWDLVLGERFRRACEGR